MWRLPDALFPDKGRVNGLAWSFLGSCCQTGCNRVFLAGKKCSHLVAQIPGKTWKNLAFFPCFRVRFCSSKNFHNPLIMMLKGEDCPEVVGLSGSGFAVEDAPLAELRKGWDCLLRRLSIVAARFRRPLFARPLGESGIDSASPHPAGCLQQSVSLRSARTDILIPRNFFDSLCELAEGVGLASPVSASLRLELRSNPTPPSRPAKP